MRKLNILLLHSAIARWQPLAFQLTLVLILSNSILSAQDDYRKGYIVHMSGDTTHGWIDYGNPKSNAKYCLFKKTLEGDPQAYYPDDLSIYRFEDSKFYFSKEIERIGFKKKYFLEYLLDGVVELYYLADPFKDYFFIEKDENLHELSNEMKTVKTEKGLRKRYVNPFGGVLTYIMQDAPSMKDKIQRAKFGHDSFIELTEEYHSLVCSPDQECIVYARQESKLNDIRLKWSFGLALGNAYSNMRNFSSVDQRTRYLFQSVNASGFYSQTEEHITGDLASAFEKTLTRHHLYPALTLNVSNKWRSSFQVELQLHHNSFALRNRKIQFTDIEMLLLAHRNFLNQKKLNPFIEFGLTFYKPIARQISSNPFTYGVPAIIDGELARIEKDVASIDLDLQGNRLNAGIALGFGALLTLSNEHQIALKLLWNYHEDKLQGNINEDLKTTQKYFVNNLLLQLGYSL